MGRGTEGQATSWGMWVLSGRGGLCGVGWSRGLRKAGALNGAMYSEGEEEGGGHWMVNQRVER